MTLVRNRQGTHDASHLAEEDFTPPSPVVPVFDRGQAREPMLDELFGGSVPFPIFHRTAVDRRPPRNTVTAAICGDPAPGRSAQDRYEQEAKCNSTSSLRRINSSSQ